MPQKIDELTSPEQAAFDGMPEDTRHAALEALDDWLERDREDTDAVIELAAAAIGFPRPAAEDFAANRDWVVQTMGIRQMMASGRGAPLREPKRMLAQLRMMVAHR